MQFSGAALTSCMRNREYYGAYRKDVRTASEHLPRRRDPRGVGVDPATPGRRRRDHRRRDQPDPAGRRRRARADLRRRRRGGPRPRCLLPHVALPLARVEPRRVLGRPHRGAGAGRRPLLPDPDRPVHGVLLGRGALRGGRGRGGPPPHRDPEPRRRTSPSPRPSSEPDPPATSRREFFARLDETDDAALLRRAPARHPHRRRRHRRGRRALRGARDRRRRARPHELVGVALPHTPRRTCGCSA